MARSPLTTGDGNGPQALGQTPHPIFEFKTRGHKAAATMPQGHTSNGGCPSLRRLTRRNSWKRQRMDAQSLRIIHYHALITKPNGIAPSPSSRNTGQTSPDYRRACFISLSPSSWSSSTGMAKLSERLTLAMFMPRHRPSKSNNGPPWTVRLPRMSC